jgi:hypothetical protein
MFSLTRAQAVDEVRAVVAVVDGWQAHFAQCGVTAPYKVFWPADQ